MYLRPGRAGKRDQDAEVERFQEEVVDREPREHSEIV